MQTRGSTDSKSVTQPLIPVECSRGVVVQGRPRPSVNLKRCHGQQRPPRPSCHQAASCWIFIPFIVSFIFFATRLLTPDELTFGEDVK